jgi:hypothetical protein
MTPWQSIDRQSDLDALGERVCWEDSETIEYYVTDMALPDFPPDVNRSGHRHPNVYILVGVCGGPARWLEMVWICAEIFDAAFAKNPFIRGRVDSLRRIEITDYTKATRMRCARLVYRFREDLAENAVGHWARIFCTENDFDVER